MPEPEPVESQPASQPSASLTPLLSTDPAEAAALRGALAAARAELQDFLYAVSHDLRAPLRHIRAYADVIREDHPGLPAEVLAHLDVMTQAAAKLQDQIDGLTTLSRLGTRDLRCESLRLIDSLARALRDTPWPAGGALLGLPAPAGGSPAAEADPANPGGPVGAQVWADPDLLAQVWAELIDNARKATAMRPCPTLRLGWQSDGSAWRVSLSDNGMGWNPTQAQALGKPFGKLHPPQVFAGLGLGLVRARKALARLGGTLHLSAQPDQGCVVTVALPGAFDSTELLQNV